MEFIPGSCLACKYQYFGTPLRLTKDESLNDDAAHYCYHTNLPEGEKEIQPEELGPKPDWCPIKKEARNA